MADSKIIYARESALNPDEFIDVLRRSTLAERRPVDDPERIKLMCRNANLIITARQNGLLVGVARSITDFVYCTYLSDLAVDSSLQKQGIGVRLIRETKKHSIQAKLILLSAPAAVNYYPKIGMKRHEYCFMLDDINDLEV
ncbi:GNAT family N-acetyltransferase [Mucilaginibacter gotjawali]|uniref:N-acetyltransferase YhbS n=1 Tax=Mucilaginibacter gotjawali TaxID=1550579 RepID=A0A839SD37_9SPHI|nr:GNAT family N-acetyltransferase [Mucilaginibacter gotjawali]MBB3054477.1 putative N-acetyltransferase YhbS [Mucilaginibacter gotjawali]